MGVELPADLMRDYDMLQLLGEDEDEVSEHEETSSPPSTSPEKELQVASPLDADAVSSSATSPADSPKTEDLTGFLLEDEIFLREMEQSDDAINLDTLPDLDMMLPLSPAANSWLDAVEDSPCKTDDEVGSPLLQDGRGIAPMSPLRLFHSDSSWSDHTDCSVADSPRPEDDEEVQDEMELLTREEKYLTAQKEFLEFKGKCGAGKPQRKSVKTKRRGRSVAAELKLLMKSKEDNQLLSGLAMQQKMYADNFKAMLAFAPVNDLVRLFLPAI
ncbi:unnamed protein product [Phytophthora lilii]|uniref:Unnamed protein product n=1 Tax=Phytophthora lilii TaxID=2077276 RepID=A0A9W6U001_9STRA|nr:unnamed protein product [Phytophthora lilii]